MKKNIVALFMLAITGVVAGAGAVELNGLKAADVRAAGQGYSTPAAQLEKSNYPQDYASQRVRVVAKGPMIAAVVGSGVMDQRLVIGYKKTGVLGADAKLSAVVKATYYGGDGQMKVSERVIDVPREWNGTGFMTRDMIHQDYITLVDGTGFRGIQKMEFAFFSGGLWDSNYGANYVVDQNEFASSNVQFVTDVYSTVVTVPSWDFIVAQMRK